MQDATFLSEQLKNKRISFKELVSDISKKAEIINPQINALVTFDPDEAVREYEKNLTLRNTLFGGVPLPLKMLGQTKINWPATASAKLLARNVARNTDNFVVKLEKSGFVPLGQTNTPEFGFKNITDPTFTGVTRNPWNLDYYSGGSSGGAAAAVAAGIFPAAAASDGGGSIRIPAAFCGLIGLKPTRGTMPTGPGNWRSWQGASINFALTVSMRDTIKMFYALRESNPSAAYQAPLIEWQQTQPANKQKLRIGYTTKSPVDTIVSAASKGAVKSAVLFLQSQGHEVDEVALPIDGIELMRQYYLMNGADTASMFTKMGQTMKRTFTNQDMEPMTWGIYQYGLKIPAYRYVQSLDYWDQCAERMERLFDSYDLLLTPTNADIAPKISEDLQSAQIREQLLHAQDLSESENADLVWKMFAKSLAITPFTQLANLTGQPAISLPTSSSENGLPLGIQFMAARGREDLLFQAGLLFEIEQKFVLPKSYQ